MAKDTTLSATDWLEVRSRVSNKIKAVGSQQHDATRERIAEQLLLSGYVDIEFIKSEMDSEKARAEEVARKRQEREDAERERVEKLREAAKAPTSPVVKP